MFYAEDRSMPLVLGVDDLIFFDDEDAHAAQAVRVVLEQFDEGKEACASGLVLVPWSELLLPTRPGAFSGVDRFESVSGAGGGGGESKEEGGTYEEFHFYSAYEGLYSYSGDLRSTGPGYYDDQSISFETYLGSADAPVGSEDVGGGAGDTAAAAAADGAVGATSTTSSGEGNHHQVSSAPSKYDLDLLSDMDGVYRDASISSFVNDFSPGNAGTAADVGYDEDDDDYMPMGLPQPVKPSRGDVTASTVAGDAAASSTAAALSHLGGNSVASDVLNMLIPSAHGDGNADNQPEAMILPVVRDMAVA